MVFQQYNLWPHLKVLDNLTAAPIKVLKQNKKDARIKAKSSNTTRIQDKLDSWPLSYLAVNNNGCNCACFNDGARCSFI